MEQTKLTGYPSIDKPWERGKTYFQKHPIIPPIIIYTLIKLINKGNMDSPAVTCHDNTYTYRNMLDDSAQLASALVKNGVRKGDIIAVCLPNFYEAVIVFLACNKIGAIFTCLNANASISEIQYYINLYHTAILFTHRTDMTEALFVHTELKKLVLIGKEKCDVAKSIPFADFLTQGKPHWKGGVTFNSKDDALILYTSGTTGKPKSVVLTNENCIAAILYAKNTSTDIEIDGTKTLICVPFSYPYGLITSFLTSILWKKETILAPYIGINTAETYFSYKPNIIFGSPAMLNVTMRGLSQKKNLSYVKCFISGGDFLSESQAEKGKGFFKERGSVVEIGNGFGNAETVSCGTTPFAVKSKPSTAGKVLVGTDVMIVDPTTYGEKRYCEEGLMLASGKHVFREYYHEPELTKAAKVTDRGREYFITGTMGFIDEDGYFTLTGRQSRFYINASLNKIYLDHVQKIIGELECVEACAVVKVPNEKELFVNKAFIVLKQEYEPTEDTKQAILDRLKGNAGTDDTETLKSYEIPTYMEFVNHLPLMEGSEKVDYRALEERAAKEV